MKNQQFKFVLGFVFLLAFIGCQKTISKPSETSTENTDNQAPTYDSIKAVQYGADQYGMKKYVIAFLKRGPNKDLDSLKRIDLQRTHMNNINRLAKEGKLVLAGPFFGNDDLRGIYIFNVPSIEEAEKLTNTDPSIKAGVLEMELKEWYGSAALMSVNEIHNTLSKKDI